MSPNKSMRRAGGWLSRLSPLIDPSQKRPAVDFEDITQLVPSSVEVVLLGLRRGVNVCASLHLRLPKNPCHFGSHECRLCLTLHTNEASKFKLGSHSGKEPSDQPMPRIHS